LRAREDFSTRQAAENLVREAYMRRKIHRAVADGFKPEQIVVVTGAFHATALGPEFPPMTDGEFARLRRRDSRMTLIPYSLIEARRAVGLQLRGIAMRSRTQDKRPTCLRGPLNAALPWRQVSKALKAVTSRQVTALQTLPRPPSAIGPREASGVRLRALNTRVVAFDTEVVDLTEQCGADPVDMIFGVQLGGGTDINKAVAYCQKFMPEPAQTIFFLISDLIEGGNQAQLVRRLKDMVESGVRVICLLALSDSGIPTFDERFAKRIAEFGVPCFGCTPNKLPELIEGVRKKQDLKALATRVGSTKEK
jgi:hypothetical protein